MKVQHLFEALFADKRSVNLNKCNLTSLKQREFPEIVSSFECRHNELTTLEGSPRKVDSTFDCSKNALVSLEGAPDYVNGDFMCEHNQLTSLKGIPDIGGNLFCAYNNLTLKNLHKEIKTVDCGYLNFKNNPVKYVLSCLLIKGVVELNISNFAVGNIINKYLPNTRGMDAVFDCQEELIEAGFEEYAEL